VRQKWRRTPFHPPNTADRGSAAGRQLCSSNRRPRAGRSRERGGRRRWRPHGEGGGGEGGRAGGKGGGGKGGRGGGKGSGGKNQAIWRRMVDGASRPARAPPPLQATPAKLDLSLAIAGFFFFSVPPSWPAARILQAEAACDKQPREDPRNRNRSPCRHPRHPCRPLALPTVEARKPANRASRSQPCWI